MAAKTIGITNVPVINTSIVGTAATTLNLGADGGLITPTKSNERLLIELTGGAAATTFTFEAGDGYAAQGDVSVTVPIGEVHYIQIETGRFLITSGTNKGKILITSDKNDGTARAFQLYL